MSELKLFFCNFCKNFENEWITYNFALVNVDKRLDLS